MFAALKMLFVYVTLGVPAGLIGIPLTLLTRDIGWMYRVGTRIAHLGLKAAGIRIDLQGMENVPVGQACIFMSNHVSNLDPPVLVPLVPGRASVMLKAELMKIPVLGPAMRMGKYVPVERNGSRAGAIASIRAATDAINSGLHMVVFAEGTRSRTGRLLPFKKGPFHLAVATGAPIVPVAIWGTESMMQKGSTKVMPGVAHVRFLPVIQPAAFADRDELMRVVRRTIASALPAEMRPLEDEVDEA